MPKEFNLDDYQYVEEHITYADFLRYGPQKNHLDDAAAFNGTLYQHVDAQWDHIVQLPVGLIWTLYRAEDGLLKIRNGYRVDGRLGYFHCAQHHNAHGTIVVIDDGLEDLNF
jgi:hypothetical protein